LLSWRISQAAVNAADFMWVTSYFPQQKDRSTV